MFRINDTKAGCQPTDFLESMRDSGRQKPSLVPSQPELQLAAQNRKMRNQIIKAGAE